MAFRAMGVALLLSILPIAGCGTVANLVQLPAEEGGKSPFGGVRRDVVCIKKSANGELALRAQPKSGPQQEPQLAPLLLCAADVPLSLMGDTLTWPYTAAYSWINQPIPVPPVAQAPAPPVSYPTSQLAPPTPPLQSLPEPRKLP